jgi:copper homeostasis protein
MEVVRKNLNAQVMVMIRPRGGDFLYNQLEIEVMIHDIQMAKELQMDGVVMGVLQQNGEIDKAVMKQLIEVARPMQVTFHRAFDLTPDPVKSLHDLIELGVDRVLTSGQRHRSFEGMKVIKALIDLAAGQIAVMPGGGISEYSVKEIMEYTGASEFHVSASGTRPSGMKYRKDQVLMGIKETEYTVEIADPARIRRFREIVDQLTSNH